jgi:hypothetical protein
MQSPTSLRGIMPSVSRLLLVASLAGLAAFGAACGDDDSGPSTPTFPNVAGVYQISGTFDEATSEEASFTGTVEVTQATLESGVLGGNLEATLNILGEETPISGALTSASVTESGAIAWTVTDEGITWRFNGNMSGTGMSGRHLVNDSVEGDWSATNAATIRLASAIPSR